MALPVWATKVLVLLSLFVLTFAFSMIPIKVMKVARKALDPTKKHRYKSAISFCSCYAAGVFLATCLLDLFPEVRDKLTTAFDQYEIYSSFPFAEFVMVFGLFLILLIEQIVLFAKERHSDDHEHKPLLLPKERSRSNSLHSRHGDFQRSLSIGIRDEPILNNQSNASTTSLAGSSYGHENSMADSEVGFIRDTGHEGHSHGYDYSIHQDQSSHSVVRSLVMLLALSLHSIFEGLAVGLQGSNTEVLQIFAALTLHKSILAFSLGINLVQSKLSFWAIVRANLLFCITAPIGIAIGIGVLDLASNKESNLTSGVLQGIACGTFLYITFFEVLPHEFNNSEHRLLKVLFLVLGFGTVTAIMFINPDKPHPRYVTIDNHTVCDGC